MQESPKVILIETNLFSRRACLTDFFDTVETNLKNKHKVYSCNDIDIAKNQQEFGHKKRIKP